MNHHPVSRRIAEEESVALPTVRGNRTGADSEPGTGTPPAMRLLHEQQLMARERERFEIVMWDEA